MSSAVHMYTYVISSFPECNTHCWLKHVSLLRQQFIFYKEYKIVNTAVHIMFMFSDLVRLFIQEKITFTIGIKCT